MPNSPTIVSAALSDKELQASINQMVANFDKGLQDMLDHTNTKVKEINEALKGIGNVNFGAKGSNDGGVVKQTKAQNEFTDAVKKSTNEIKRQGKEQEMTFDQIVSALSQARRAVSDFNTKRASGILPSSEDYKRYEQALARIVEFNDKLKQSALSRADANQWVNAFDGKGLVKDFFSVDERLKQLNQYYKEEEKSSQKATAAIKENTQAKKENASVDQPVKSARDSYIAFMQGYKQQAEQIRRLIEEEQKVMQQRRQGVVDGFSKTIEERKARVKELSEEISKLYKERPDGYRDAIKQRTEEMNALKQKIRELTDAQKNLADSPIGASNRYLELEKEYNRIKNIMIDTTNAQRQSTQETEKQTQAAKEYSEQVKKIAAEIRESAQWQKSDKFGFKRGMMNLDGRAYPVTENLEMGLRLEDQIVSILQRANDERQKGVQITQQQAQSSRQVSEEDRKAMESLGWVDSQQKRKYTPPMMNIERISEARGALQSITGMQEAWVDSINKTKSSYYQLSDYVKQLKNELIHLPKGVHDEAAKVLIREIQQAEREMQKFQQTMSRPVSLKDALSGSEKTLDDIAYKMRQLASYRSGLNIKTQANEIEQVNRKYAELQKSMNDIMRKNTEMIKSNTAVGRSWNYMKNRLAFYFTVGAGTQFVKNLIEVRSQYEMNERALGILINSAERGTQIFNELSQMALVSPYTLIELSTAAKQLTAYDIAAKDVVDTTRRLADMAAAVGIPIERLTYALGQIKAYGYLNSRDARMFANAGIPLVKQLSDYYTELEGRLVSTADVYDRIKKKAIDYNEVMEVINKMTDQGGKFFDFQAKMADTLKVRLANLTLAWNNMLNDMGKQSQGVLTWGIGALREMFLHWKQLDSLIKNAAWALGIRTALMFIAYSALKAGAALGVTTKQMALSAVFGERLANVLKTVAATMKTVAMSKWTWISLFAIAAVEATQALFGVNEAQKALNESIRNGAKDNYDNISKFIEQYKEVRDSLYKTVTKPVPNGMLNVQEWTDNQGNKWHNVSREYTETLPQDIDKNEAQKAWEAVREQIELTVASSDKYIGNLLSISNMSERVRQGFNLLDDVQVVNAALKELDNDTIKVSKDMSAWWNAWQAPDGLIGNLKDLVDAENELIETYGSVEAAKKGGGKLYTDYEKRELANFRDDLRETTNSIINFIELKGWSGNEGKINQVFEQITQKLVLDNQLDPQKAFTLQTKVEEARSKVAKEALLQRINDEKAALKIAHDDSVREALAADIERYKKWDETNGRSKVEWERFTKWLKEQHISETTAMFRNMDAEDIKSLNFQEGKHAEWVTRMVTQYAKEHKMSIDDVERYLKNFVRNANQMSIFIPLIISTEDKKSVYDQLGEYDKAVDEADAQIERLTKRINELNAKKKKSKEETQELANAEQELADAQKAKADAEAKGGHGKKEKKDEKAANKAAKQAETELQKALKDELSTIDKVRSIYKDLTKEGMSHANAVERATRGWDETVNAINKVLKKNGLQKLDLSKFAGIENPRELVNMLQSQLNTLLKRGAKPAEIKELQTKIQTLNVDAEKYDLTKITKGLNSELDKLKDEYELAVELDANPELGDMFADMFGINTSTLPKTFGDALDRAQTIINRKLAEMNITTPFDLMDGNIDSFAKSTGLDKDSAIIKELVSAQNAYRDMFKKNITETEKVLDDYIKKYGDYSDKIAEIEAGRLEKLKKLNEAYYNEEMRKRPEYVAKLNAIEQGASKEKQQVDFDEFKNSRYYTMMFENLDYISTKTIRDMRDRVRELMDTMNDLTPEQLKTLISQYEKLEQKLVKRSPFKTLTKDLKVYFATTKERKAANIEFKNAQKEYDIQKKNVAALKEKYEQAKANSNTSKSRLDFLQIEIDGENDILKILKQQLDAAQKKSDKYNLTAKLAKSEALAVAQVVSSNLQSLGELRDFLQQDLGIELSDELNGLVDGLSKVGQGINKITSSASSGDVVGVVTGVGQTIYGLYDGIASIFGGGSTSDKKITKQIQESERAVKRLELAYIDLEHAVDKAMGTAVIGAKQATLANKELQLAEIQRQITLEKSRDAKERDEDKIIDLQKQYRELFYEIRDGYTEIVDDLMGTDVSSFAENLVSSMISAFKEGEDYMKVFSDKFDEMIDNMIMKSIVSRVVSSYMNRIWDDIDERINERSKDQAASYENAQREASRRAAMSDEEILEEIYKNSDKPLGLLFENINSPKNKKLIEEYRNAAKNEERAAKERLDAATMFADSDIDFVMSEISSVMPELGEKLKNILGEYYKFGESSDKNLSALQQGISQISETTAESLEAYMNGVSQQVYYHSTLLEQIRDSVAGLDLDVSLGVQSQMLLQLQNSYQTQQAIQQILEGVLTPSGRAFSVELVS